jgi:hypothetical protein
MGMWTIDINIYHPDKSAIAKHITNQGHHIQLQDTGILAKKSRCMDQTISEAMEINLHPNNMTREDNFSLRRSSFTP